MRREEIFDLKHAKLELEGIRAILRHLWRVVVGARRLSDRTLDVNGSTVNLSFPVLPRPSSFGSRIQGYMPNSSMQAIGVIRDEMEMLTIRD